MNCVRTDVISWETLPFSTDILILFKIGFMIKNGIAMAIMANDLEIENAWSPLLGDVTIENVTTSSDGEYLIVIAGKSEPFREVRLNGDGKFSPDGEVVLFPYRYGKEEDWARFLPLGDVILSKMEDCGNFTDVERDYVKRLCETKKPLCSYWDERHTKESVIESLIDDEMVDRIATAMEALDWKWLHIDGIPTAKEIRRAIKERLEDLFRNDANTQYFISSGGLEAGFETYAPEDGEDDTFENCVNVYVKFVLDEVSTM